MDPAGFEYGDSALIRWLNRRWSPVWAMGFALGCIGFGLAISAVVSDNKPERDYLAETMAILERRAESPEIIECVVNTESYDLSAGPMSDVALSQLVEACRAGQTSSDDQDPTDSDDEPAQTQTEDFASSAQSLRPVAAVDRAASLRTALSENAGDELDRLRELCGAGSGVDCDRLFELSPPDSDYEQFGLTCGDRPEVVNCTDLVLEQEPESEAAEIDG